MENLSQKGINYKIVDREKHPNTPDSPSLTDLLETGLGVVHALRGLGSVVRSTRTKDGSFVTASSNKSEIVSPLPLQK